MFVRVYTDEAGNITRNPSLVALLNYYGLRSEACRPYRAKTKGKIERPFRHFRQDFFLAPTFRNMDDFNTWRAEVSNQRVHATTHRIVDEAFAEADRARNRYRRSPNNAVLKVVRRVSRGGMVSVRGNLYSVPDTTRRRTLKVEHHATELRILEDGQLVNRYPVLECKPQRRIDPAHRKAPPPRPVLPTHPQGLRRPLDF